MLVLFFYIIKFGRATVLYIFGNIIRRMSRRVESIPWPADSEESVKKEKVEETEGEAQKEVQKEVGQDRVQRIDTTTTTCTLRTEKCTPSPTDNKRLGYMAVDTPLVNKTPPHSTRKRSSDDAEAGKSELARLRAKKKSKGMNMTDSKMMHGTQYPEENVMTSGENVLVFSTPKDSPTYNMNLPKRGKCVIFNHQKFGMDDEDDRDGSEYDVESIKKSFGTLGFEVVIHTDLIFADVMEVINLMSKEDHSDCDCICIFVLTHGLRNGLIWASDACYPLQNIWSPFTADNCPTLASKPKLFFIQACRGRNTDPGVKGKSATDSGETSYTIPTHADMLFGFSTVDDFFAWRSLAGTCYIQSLCKVIDDNWKEIDLLRMLTLTSRKVAFEFVSQHSLKYLTNMKQMPTFSSTLIRDLYFVPKSTT